MSLCIPGACNRDLAVSLACNRGIVVRSGSGRRLNEAVYYFGIPIDVSCSLQSIAMVHCLNPLSCNYTRLHPCCNADGL